MAQDNNSDDQKERSVAQWLREKFNMEVKEQESQTAEEAAGSLRETGGVTIHIEKLVADTGRVGETIEDGEVIEDDS